MWTWKQSTNNMRTIKEIIIHCSATAEGRNVTTEQIRHMHTAPVSKGGRGWNDIGYHYVIELDGSVHIGRPESVIGAHCKGHNSNSLGVCYVGGLAADGKTQKDTRTVAQYDAMTKLLRQLKQKYPQASIYGHREFANKSCPCFDVKKYLKTVGLALMALIIMVFIPSCATQKRTTDAQIRRVDDTATEQLHAGSIFDSRTKMHLLDEQTNHQDSMAMQKTNLIVEFTFIPNGGTVNTITGEMTGIASANMQADIEQMQHKINDKEKRIQALSEQLIAARDSINATQTNEHTESDEDIHEQQDSLSRPFGWKFCIICTILFWIVVAYKIVTIILKIYTRGKL